MCTPVLFRFSVFLVRKSCRPVIHQGQQAGTLTEKNMDGYIVFYPMLDKVYSELVFICRSLSPGFKA